MGNRWPPSLHELSSAKIPREEFPTPTTYFCSFLNSIKAKTTPTIQKTKNIRKTISENNIAPVTVPHQAILSNLLAVKQYLRTT
jgi:hypothetical protein